MTLAQALANIAADQKRRKPDDVSQYHWSGSVIRIYLEMERDSPFLQPALIRAKEPMAFPDYRS